MNITELTRKIEVWAVDRNLHTADSRGQVLKLFEEFGELTAGINKAKPELIKDAIGDMYVVLTILSLQQKLDMAKMEWVGSEGEGGFYIIEEVDHILMIGGMIGQLADEFDGYLQSGKEEKFSIVEALLEKINDVATENNFTLTDCVAMAYNEIKDRKGKMIDGVFVKDSDLMESGY